MTADLHNVVLVLGAGASVELGYPTGRGLLEEIRTLCQRYIRGYRSESNTLRQRIETYGYGSIDAILAREPDLSVREFGKAMVAASILIHEDQTKILDDNWYSVFARKLLPDDFQKRNDHEKVRSIIRAFSSLSLITFNYDLSFESFVEDLFTRAISDHEMRQAALSFVAHRLIHVYGSVGRLDWQGGTRSRADYGGLRKGLRRRKVGSFLDGMTWGEAYPKSDLEILVDRCLPRKGGIFGGAGVERPFDDYRLLFHEIRVIGEDRGGRIADQSRIVSI